MEFKFIKPQRKNVLWGSEKINLEDMSKIFNLNHKYDSSNPKDQSIRNLFNQSESIKIFNTKMDVESFYDQNTTLEKCFNFNRFKNKSIDLLAKILPLTNKKAFKDYIPSPSEPKLKLNVFEKMGKFKEIDFSSNLIYDITKNQVKRQTIFTKNRKFISKLNKILNKEPFCYVDDLIREGRPLHWLHHTHKVYTTKECPGCLGHYKLKLKYDGARKFEIVLFCYCADPSFEYFAIPDDFFKT